MALVKETIKTEVRAAFAQVMNDTEDREAALDKVAEGLAGAITDAVKSITITYVGGLATSTGAVTGAFQCTIE